ncbi:MAG: U32 family peptidase, partial [Clostridia bacterium]|nr:U32 family peptidase [Clostridia bacterium]
MEDAHGNRGLCAGPCRLPYTLLDETEREYDKGYLLSPRDLMGTSSLPELIKAGVNCFKIEGRLKNPEYVGIVTRYYRKLIDIVYDNLDKSNEELLKLLEEEESKINPSTSMSYLDELKQSFNRGGFSKGHFSKEANKELIYKEMASNSGFYLGKVQNFNPNKGYITLKLEHSIGIGDKISIDSDNYTISELMKQNTNIRLANIGEVVTIGRMKGNIRPGQKIYKLQSRILNDDIAPTFKEDKEFKKIKLNAFLTIKKNEKMTLEVFSNNLCSIYNNERISISSNSIIEPAQNRSATKEDIFSQITKTGNTPFEFEKIEIQLDDNVFVPVKLLNELRRTALEQLQNKIIEKHIHARNLKLNPETLEFHTTNSNLKASNSIHLLLTILHENIDYSNYLNGIDKLYIPLKYFLLNQFQEELISLCNLFNTYVYMPNIIRDLWNIDYDKIVNTFFIKGFVISSTSQIDIVKRYNLEMIGNYNL